MIFWFGNIYEIKDLKKYSYLSPAASQWQKNIIEAIKSEKKKIKVLSYLDIKAWPIEKKIFIRRSNKKNKNLNFLNIIFFKHIYLFLAFVIFFLKFRSKKESNVIFSYNFNVIIITAIKFLKLFFKIKWYPIIADFDQNKKKSIEKKIDEAHLNIYLSKFAYKKAIVMNKKILLHGGINQLNRQLNLKKKTLNFLYSGSLGGWVGIENFLKNFVKLKSRNIKLYITSSSPTTNIDKYIVKDNRIFFLGFLSEKKLLKTLKKTDICINLRNVFNVNNYNNFPSKILLYLQYSKLILSDDNKSFSKCIEDALILIKNNNYHQSMKKIIENYNFIYKKKFQFIKKAQKEMLWSNQIKKINL